MSLKLKTILDERCSSISNTHCISYPKDHMSFLEEKRLSSTQASVVEDVIPVSAWMSSEAQIIRQREMLIEIDNLLV